MAAAAALGQYDHMVHTHYLNPVRQLHAERDAKLSAIHTPSDAEAYVESMRAPVANAFAALPTGRCPLNPAVTRIITGNAYDIELLHFDSRPGLPVTANLYLPKACRNAAVRQQVAEAVIKAICGVTASETTPDKVVVRARRRRNHTPSTRVNATNTQASARARTRSRCRRATP